MDARHTLARPAAAIAATAALLLVASSPGHAVDRTWTNVEGVTVVGELVRVDDGNVSLRIIDPEGGRGQRPAGRRPPPGGGANGGDPPPPPRRVVRLPLRRLSVADQEWIARHDEMRVVRRWGESPAEDERDDRPRGRLVRVQNGKAVIERRGSQTLVPLAELSYDDFVHLEAWHEHYGEPLSDEALARKPPKPKRERAKPRHLARTGQPARAWTDTLGRTVTARFAGTEEGKVVLSINGKEYRTPLTRLSREDQRWVAQQAFGKLGQDVFGGFAWLGEAAGGGPPLAGGPFPQDGPNAVGTIELQTPVQPQRVPEFNPRDRSIRGRAEALAPPVAARETPPVPPRTRPAPPSPAPTAVAELAREEPTAPVAAEPLAESEPTEFQPVDDIGDLSPNQIEARLEEVFGDEDLIGFAECEHCYAEFGYPASYSEGDPCPFCTRPVTELVSMEEIGDAISEAFERDERPWYATRGGRRLIIALVVAILGVAIKAMTDSGGG